MKRLLKMRPGCSVGVACLDCTGWEVKAGLSEYRWWFRPVNRYLDARYEAHWWTHHAVKAIRERRKG